MFVHAVLKTKGLPPPELQIPNQISQATSARGCNHQEHPLPAQDDSSALLTESLTQHACHSHLPSLPIHPFIYSPVATRPHQTRLSSGTICLLELFLCTFIYFRYTNQIQKCSLYICISLGFVRLTTKSNIRSSRPDSSKNSSWERTNFGRVPWSIIYTTIHG